MVGITFLLSCKHMEQDKVDKAKIDYIYSSCQITNHSMLSRALLHVQYVYGFIGFLQNMSFSCHPRKYTT